MSNNISIRDLELHELGNHLNNIEDVKEYLNCVISEDETLDAVKYSIEILTVALERLTK